MTLNELWTELDELERAVEDKAVACQLNLDADVIDIHRRDAESARGKVERAFKSLLARQSAADAELAALRDALPKSADGVAITLGFRAWYIIIGDEGACLWRGTVTGICAARIWVRPDNATGLSGDEELEPRDLYHVHPETGLTVEQAERQAREGESRSHEPPRHH